MLASAVVLRGFIICVLINMYWSIFGVSAIVI